MAENNKGKKYADMTSEELALERTMMGLERTVLAHERTLMAWVRTATSMISFGFTIYKLLSQVRSEEEKILSPRLVGMSMILMGLIGLLLALIQNYRAMKKLRNEYPDAKSSISSVLAIVVLMFGVLLFLGALYRQ